MVFGLFGRSKAAANQTDDEQRKDDGAQQLRTPSPTGSVGTAPPQSPEPADAARVVKRARSMSPAKTGLPLEEPQIMPPMNAEELLTLFKKVPPKTLHEFVIKNVSNASLQEVTALTEFFATLRPPPALHCVRCHKNYVEVENTETSCLVPHDDETAEVEYVGGSRKTTYETLWGCCNKTVEVC